MGWQSTQLMVGHIVGFSIKTILQLIIEKDMGNKLTIPIYIFLWSISINNALAQTGDSVEYIKVSKGVMSFKKVNSKEVEFKFQGAKLNELLSLADFFYVTDHPLTT